MTMTDTTGAPGGRLTPGELARFRAWQAADPGRQPWFEYHCWESEDSSDAELWHRTHQQVCIIGGPFSDGQPVSALAEWRLAEAGEPVLYRVRFADGFEGDVFVDELTAGPDCYTRPDYVRQTAPDDQETAP